MATTKLASKLTDFRTAAITNHWNDPPEKIFNKEVIKHDRQYGISQITVILRKLLNDCKQFFVTGIDKRILVDTEKRIDLLFEKLEKYELPENVIVKLSQICECLESRDFANALTIQGNLMTTDFEKEGKWLLGIKRLIDLYKKKV
nr:963_t:CDS:2 [Entrophospora candida]